MYGCHGGKAIQSSSESGMKWVIPGDSSPDVAPPCLAQAMDKGHKPNQAGNGLGDLLGAVKLNSIPVKPKGLFDVSDVFPCG